MKTDVLFSLLLMEQSIRDHYRSWLSMHKLDLSIEKQCVVSGANRHAEWVGVRASVSARSSCSRKCLFVAACADCTGFHLIVD